MSRYLILFEAENSLFPTDLKELLHLWEGILAGADQLFNLGMKDLGWFSPREGYAIIEAESKAKLLGLVSAFFPLYNQEIREIASHAEAKEELLASARRSAQR